MSRPASSRRPLWVDGLILLFAGVVFVTMFSLGNWQMQRLAWKVDLIEQVNARAFEAPISLPIGPVDTDTHAYTRLSASGYFRHDLSQEIKAVTELGGGHWIMTPLITEGHIVWVNRGFVPTGRDAVKINEPSGTQQVEGLLRISEPDGTLLEKNNPGSGRWVSRDVQALSENAGLENALPYFVDADHFGPAEQWPRGGLTKVSFRNSHLSYALTWYAMAILFFGAMAFVIYDRLREQRAEH